MMEPPRRIAWPFLLLVAGAGCYSYVPADGMLLDPGVAVRARVSGEAAQSLAEVLPSADRLLEGTVVQGDSAELMLDVPAVTRQTSLGAQTLHQRVRLRRGDIQTLEVRRLNRVKTGGAIALALAAGAYTASGIFGEPGSDRPPGGDGPLDSRVALLRFLRIAVP